MIGRRERVRRRRKLQRVRIPCPARRMRRVCSLAKCRIGLGLRSRFRLQHSRDCWSSPFCRVEWGRRVQGSLMEARLVGLVRLDCGSEGWSLVVLGCHCGTRLESGRLVRWLRRRGLWRIARRGSRGRRRECLSRGLLNMSAKHSDGESHQDRLCHRAGRSDHLGQYCQ